MKIILDLKCLRVPNYLMLFILVFTWHIRRNLGKGNRVKIIKTYEKQEDALKENAHKSWSLSK